MVVNKKLRVVLINIVISFGSVFAFSQSDTLYLDENNNYISKTVFYKKEKSSVYKGIRFSTDTLVVEKLRFKYFFGSLKPKIKTQLNQLLKKRHQIDTTKTLIIHYIDTLKSKSDFPKRSRTIFYDSLGKEVKIRKSNIAIAVSQQKKIVRHKHIVGYKDFISAHKKCERKHKKYKNYALVLHFYRYNSGHPKTYKELRWYKDYGGIIRKIFSDNYKNFDNIIFHPNGKFYLGYNSKFSYDDLIKKRKWNDYEKKFNQRVKALNNY